MMNEQQTREEASRITDKIYKAYGTDREYLLGLHPSQRNIVEVIVYFTLKEHQEYSVTI